MSIRFDAATDGLFRTSTVPAFGDFSVTLWAYRTTDTGAGAVIFTLCATGYVAGLFLIVNPTTDILNVQDQVGTVLVAEAAGAWSVGTWKRIGVTFNNTSNVVTLYAQGVAATGSYTGSFTVGILDVGGLSGADVANFNGRVANLKDFTAELSAARIAEELNYFTVQNAASLWGAWKLKTETDLNDYSGNGRTLTAEGLATEADPPIADSPTRPTPSYRQAVMRAAHY